MYKLYTKLFHIFLFFIILDTNAYTLLDKTLWFPQDFDSYTPFPKPYKGFQLQIVWLEGTLWTSDIIKKKISELSEIYKQCDIYLNLVHLFHVSHDKIHWEKNSSLGENSVTHLRKSFPMSQDMITIYLVGPFLDAKESAGFSNTRWRRVKEKRPVLRDTIFLSDYSLSEEYNSKRQNSPYSIWAHELMHIFTRKIGHFNSHPHHILNIWKTRSDYILPEHCKLLKDSPHLSFHY